MPKKKVEIKNPYNYDHEKDSCMEKSTGPSMTVPDESYTIPELLQKHQSGIPVNVGQEGFYDDEPEHDDYDKRELLNMDLSEQDEILQEQRRLQAVIKEELEEQKKAKEVENEQNEERPEPKKETESSSETPSIQEEKKQ